VKTEDGV